MAQSYDELVKTIDSIQGEVAAWRHNWHWMRARLRQCGNPEDFYKIFEV